MTFWMASKSIRIDLVGDPYIDRIDPRIGTSFPLTALQNYVTIKWQSDMMVPMWGENRNKWGTAMTSYMCVCVYPYTPIANNSIFRAVDTPWFICNNMVQGAFQAGENKGLMTEFLYPLSLIENNIRQLAWWPDRLHKHKLSGRIKMSDIPPWLKYSTK